MVRARAVVPAVATTVAVFGGSLVGAVRDSLRVRGGEATDAWRQVLGDPRFQDALWFSLRITVAATVLSVVLAVPLGALVRRSRLVRAATGVPIVLPHLLVAVVAVLWLGPGGLGDRLVGGLPVVLVRDQAGWGVVLAYLYKEVPFLALLIAAAWTPVVDDRLEAAATLGASRLQQVRWVLWPAVRTSVVTGAVVVAAFVFGAFEIPLLLGPTTPRTLATYALEVSRTGGLDGRAMATVALLVAAGGAIALAALAAPFIGRSDD